MSLLRNVFKSMRINQWIKNLFLFIPFIFGGKLFIPEDLIRTVLAFLLFCITSSGVYIINDILDRKKDRFHPLKKNRPITSGALPVKQALVISSILLFSSLLLSAYFNIHFFVLLLAYVVLHLLYSFILKREVLLDVILIALGFELRIWAGAVILLIIPSIWLQLCVFLLAIFLALLKRRHEKISLYPDAANHRNVLTHYDIYFLDQLIMISATLCITFYLSLIHI